MAATYASGGSGSIDTVPDSRGVTLVIHYSISRLQETGYQPRLADDRVGHFLTVVKDFSKTGADDQFVRYVNRWDLRKIEPTAKVSPPVTPIIFWIEKTVPYKFRAAVREGILEWNKAFEKAGFSNAIEVRQQPDDATWDPEDINYNTFRWITAERGLRHGPEPRQSDDRPNPRRRHHLRRRFRRPLDEDLRLDKPGAAATLRRAGLDRHLEIMQPHSAAAAGDTPTTADAFAIMPRGWPSNWPSARWPWPPAGSRPTSRSRSCWPRRQVSRRPRGRPHARPAAQLQGQHAADDGRTERPGEDPQRAWPAP